MKKYTINILLFIAVSCILFFSCKKETFITTADARISTNVYNDTIKFDTIFTSVGSITQIFKVFNLNDQKLRLSNVRLMGGNTSSYSINVNGIANSNVTNIEIAANDSIYIFVSVNINPTLENTPFIIEDSIQISYNGNNQFIHLQAFGQNAHFLNNKIITTDTTWTNDLPYVIVGELQIDTAISLTIEKGCNIYVHANGIVIIDGTLNINGTQDEPVIFTGDRLDQDYKDLPASWTGILFRGTSKNNTLTHSIIKNATNAIIVQSPADNTNPKVTLHQCIIDNSSQAGISGINSSLNADNTLITNCGSNISLTHGGEYTFTHCTVASYSTNYVHHNNPVLTINNFTTIENTIDTKDLNASFINCIFWGDYGGIANEITATKQNGSAFNVIFDNCLYKADSNPANCTFNNVIINQDPLFDSVNTDKRIFDFRTTKNILAPGIDQGAMTIFTEDLDGLNRNNNIPDIGCYEKQ